ncbi:3'-5' exonuclease [Cadophora gregata]|uniref:3'-5' exonuclease n=1 Tax=Cadophora gregata TaxID=51156 RepID=UPI0026DC2C05|nr:3'-5' exonuclease [Cadophora gregata]KAK0119825.1 3'-5' exonuclease [Cadophora gregata]KAK0120861.1 3'-5' exonuclease [Cadophora gregata f. sp. sojae]
MAPEFSSNWKKLQATLKAESKASTERKRKAIPTERQQNSIAKRRRLEGNPVKPFKVVPNPSRVAKKRKMGSGGSVEAAVPSPEQLEAPEDAKAPSASLALWAEDNDISPKDLAEAYGGGLKDTTIKGTKADIINGGLIEGVDIGKYVGIDCEMVGVGEGGAQSVLARVSIVNFHGTQVYDSFVKPKEFVTDWRTYVSGVSPKNMTTARDFEVVQKEIAEILEGRVLIGHAIKNDLAAMMLGHPRKDIRDTSRYSGFRKYNGGRTPSLRKLAKELLGVDIQGGEHSSIEDARATMLLFRRHKSGFDVEHAQRYPTATPGPKKPKGQKKKKGKR